MRAISVVFTRFFKNVSQKRVFGNKVRICFLFLPKVFLLVTASNLKNNLKMLWKMTYFNLYIIKPWCIYYICEKPSNKIRELNNPFDTSSSMSSIFDIRGHSFITLTISKGERRGGYFGSYWYLLYYRGGGQT